MVCADRFAFGEPFGVLASSSLTAFEMTARKKERKKRLSAAKPPINAPLSHTSRVMSTGGRHLLRPLQVDYFTSHNDF